METLVIGPMECNDPNASEAANKDKSGGQFFIFYDESEFTEAIYFDGTYPKSRRFFGEILPHMRELLVEACGYFDAATVYLGAEIGSLYAAYYCICEEIQTSVTLVDPQFLGGKSAWAQQHPLLLNKLITSILSNAFEVRIVGKEHFEKLPKAFPRIAREYILVDPNPTDTAPSEGLSLPSMDTATT